MPGMPFIRAIDRFNLTDTYGQGRRSRSLEARPVTADIFNADPDS